MLAPNLKGYDAAVAAGAKEVAVFAAASEGFSKANLNCSVAESLERFRPVVEAAARDGVAVRGYVSTVVDCPFEGAIEPEKAAGVAQALVDMGCYEVSLGDTTGAGSPGTVAPLLRAVEAAGVPMEKVAVHFHDTAGQALANVLVALQHGVAVVDSSAAGLGGCPYSPGATGNVATEDVVYMLHALGCATGVGGEGRIDLMALVDAGNGISAVLGRPNAARAAMKINAARKRHAAASA